MAFLAIAALVVLIVHPIGVIVESLVVTVLRPRHGAHAGLRDRTSLASVSPPAVMISAALANEEHVLPETLSTLARDLPEASIVVVGNGESPPLLEKLADWTKSSNRHLFLYEDDSTSKAENLNFAFFEALDLGTALVLDADSRLIPSDRVSTEQDAVIVQHPKVIRSESGSVLETMVSIETMYKHYFTYPRRARLYGLAYFSGSGAFLDVTSLRRANLRFDRRAFVEDIDLALRCILSNLRVEFDVDGPAVTETAPPTWTAWVGQRRRWAAGWLQLSKKYTGPILRCKTLPLHVRAKWLYLLVYRRLLMPAAAVALTSALVFGAPPYLATIWIACLVGMTALQVTQLVRAPRIRGGGPSEWGSALAVWAILGWAYVVGLYLIDVSVLIWPVRRWRPTPRLQSIRSLH
ncbi:MAG TPA: glycosyltransferase family 2 protein [Gaiellaceae bacterium]|nr:glycosyltransferase family 2 protein [Gaiellaceae bacterium]